MYALVIGKISSSIIKQPGNGDNFKAHHLIKVVQKSGGDSELSTIKDFDLNEKYPEDADFKKMCRISDWFFNGKSGLSCKVIDK